MARGEGGVPWTIVHAMPRMMPLFALAVLAACATCRPATEQATVPPAEVRVLPSARYDLPIGSPHPFSLEQAARNGRWIIGCQARGPGDALVPYVFRGGGAGEAIDGFVVASRDERWLVVIHDGQLRLIDDVAGTERALAMPRRGSHPTTAGSTSRRPTPRPASSTSPRARPDEAGGPGASAHARPALISA